MIYDPEKDPAPTPDEVSYALQVPALLAATLERHEQSRQLCLKMSETLEDLRNFEALLTAQLYEVLAATIEARTLEELQTTLLPLVAEKAQAKEVSRKHREAQALLELLPALQEVDELLALTPEAHPARPQTLAIRQLLEELPKMMAECADEVDFELWFTERAQALGVTVSFFQAHVEEEG